jgi:hypothetical protein
MIIIIDYNVIQVPLRRVQVAAGETHRSVLIHHLPLRLGAQS